MKLAHSQEIQGWIGEREMMQAFVPTDSISQFIYLFSDTHASYFVIIFALFVGAWVLRLFRKKQLKMVYFNDIDSVYPLLLCLLMAFSATLYESIQVFVPETWEHFYFNPTLSPFKVPFVLSVFLLSIWLFIIVLLAFACCSYVLFAGSGILLHLLLFLLYIDHADIYRLRLPCCLYLDFPEKDAYHTCCLSLSLR